MRKQYHFQPSTNGFYAWDVDKLVELSKNLPIIEIKLATIKELEQNYWYQDSTEPTCISLVEHMKLINEVSLEFPIIMSAENFVMDGMHRVCKAVMKNQRTIKVVKFMKTPAPDYEDVYPEDLAY